MINIPQGFKIGGAEAIDSRLSLSKTEMKNIKDSLMPQVYFAVCKDDNNIYIYNKNNESIGESGKFRLYAAANGISNSEPIEVDKIKSLFNKGETE